MRIKIYLLLFILILTNWAYPKGDVQHIQKEGVAKIIERELNTKQIKESVLNSGKWYKIKLRTTGVYKIDYSFLEELGVDFTKLDPRKIRIYGNGGGLIPERNQEVLITDLKENAIQVVGQEDGRFDSGDYILFYGQSPHDWEYDPITKTYKHCFNVYSDYSYYFINFDKGIGKRIQDLSDNSSTGIQIVNDFLDFQFHELDERNLISSGRTWYGEVFDINTSYKFDFEFPNIDTQKNIVIVVDVAARSSAISHFELSLNNQQLGNFTVSGINFSNSFPPYAKTARQKFNYKVDEGNLNLQLKYIKPNTSSMAWLNYLEINAWRRLKFKGGQLNFRNPEFFDKGNLKFEIEIESDPKQIWDVSDPQNVMSVSYVQENNTLSFYQNESKSFEYVITDNQSYYTPEIIGEINNQNYHGIPLSDIIILSPPEFFSEAIRLGNFHKQEGLSFCLVEPSKIYNEFSSGSPDIGGIRNFVRYMFERAEEGNKPQYLLLFGDASFDYKDRIASNDNFVPTWESRNGVNLNQSFMSDDFYGFLDAGEGENMSGSLDIGIGRLTISNIEEASIVVDKIINYSSGSDEVLGRWKNNVCFIADDEDYNTYVIDSEAISNELNTICPNVNAQKIYFDAYPQQASPGGARYPDVKNAINEAIEEGALVVNYIGHGGETGWAHERVLKLSDIHSWTNKNKLPIFITATCEFTRLDDPERKSAGEYVLSNANGGGIALYTTTRATSSGGNFQLNKSVINAIFKNWNHETKRLGDIILEAKNAVGNTINGQKFVLVGDPAIKIPLPADSISVLKINNQVVNIEVDTISALSVVSIEGSVFDLNQIKQTGFNGKLYPVVFDKASNFKTLSQDPTSIEQDFKFFNNVLYKGDVSVVNGDFSFSFVVPKDIAYNYDFGKISLYAKSENGLDAWGVYDQLMVGGIDDQANNDLKGPEIDLYLNDKNFKTGDQVPSNSILFAILNDENGINTVGTGIGHDIIAVIDEETSKPIVLNNFYEAELDNYKKGKIEYLLAELSNGFHNLRLRAWDVYNNSSYASIDFLVADSEEFLITSLKNFPNPFIHETNFQIQVNRDYSSFSIQIEIYNLQGKRVKIITREGINNSTINWDARTDNGRKLEAGIYFYRVVIKGPNGDIAERNDKLLILK